MNERVGFYRRLVCKRIKDKNASILVCGGGTCDKRVFEDLGFTTVTISNLDERMDGNEYASFKWKYENAESLSFEDQSFDYVVIHAAIHHASSPHKVLTEMYRVARKGVLAIEPCDSIIVRIFEKLKFAQTYECAAVFYNECQYGGVNNTDIPNYVYRWSERDVEKTIKSYAPFVEHNFHYDYGTGFPTTPKLENKGKLKHLFLITMKPFYWLFVKMFPKQQNLFGFYIEKPTLPEMLFSWLIFNGEKIVFNKEWGEKKFKGSPL